MREENTANQYHEINANDKRLATDIPDTSSNLNDQYIYDGRIIMQKNSAFIENRVINDDVERLDKLNFIEDMADLLCAAQKKGHRLANETHNETYDLVDELNQHLHQAHLQLRKLRSHISSDNSDTQKSSPQPDSPIQHH